MRIAQVTPYFYPHIGGVESRVINTSKYLVKKGHDVTVFTSLLPNTKEYDFYEGIEIRRVKPLFTIYKTPITPKLTKIIKDFDLVDAHTPPPLQAYYAAVACKLQKIPLVLTYHCDPEIPSLIGKLIVSIYNITLGQYTMNVASRIIVTTSGYAATSRTLWKSSVTVMPTPVDTNIFKPDLNSGIAIRKRYNLNNNDFVVLFVGRLVAHKGLEYLISSAKHTNAKYLIVGTGELKAKIEKQVAIENLKSKIILAGRADENALPGYYNACDVLVLPSTSRLEAMGLVVLEALACAKPVIVSDIPGVKETVVDGKDGFYVEPMSGKALADKINYLAEHIELCKEFGKYGREKIVQELTWDKVIDKIERVYLGAVENAR
ncbi:MAG: glycosyltransferase family 4 protein [Candidatus Thermoplasmatota archaeon]|nr:glycosyltransferase family 4 protein [Candidatus Thermoplasmatota archaeon]